MSLTQLERRRDDNRSKVIFVLDGLSGAVQEVIFLRKHEEVPGAGYIFSF